MGTIFTFSGTTTDNAIIPTSTWTNNPNKVAKVYINSIYAVMATKPAGANGLIPWKRVRMSVSNSSGGVTQNNILEVAYRAYAIDNTTPPAGGYTKGTNPQGVRLNDGELALEMVGGCGNNTFEYRAGQYITATTAQIAQLNQSALDVLLNNTTLTGTAKINVTVDAKVGSDPFVASLMFISYHVPEYFYLNQGDELRLHDHTGSASLRFTVVSES